MTSEGLLPTSMSLDFWVNVSTPSARLPSAAPAAVDEDCWARTKTPDDSRVPLSSRRALPLQI